MGAADGSSLPSALRRAADAGSANRQGDGRVFLAADVARGLARLAALSRLLVPAIYQMTFGVSLTGPPTVEEVRAAPCSGGGSILQQDVQHRAVQHVKAAVLFAVALEESARSNCVDEAAQRFRLANKDIENGGSCDPGRLLMTRQEVSRRRDSETAQLLRVPSARATAAC